MRRGFVGEETALVIERKVMMQEKVMRSTSPQGVTVLRTEDTKMKSTRMEVVERTMRMK